jgi:hypothetical protein
VKVGDLVRLIGSYARGERVCVIVALNEFSEGWHTLLWEGEHVDWHESQLEVLDAYREEAVG